MLWSIVKILIAGSLIALSAWVADRKPVLAGFIIALPLSSIFALSLTCLEFQNPQKVVTFARSIFFAVPLSLFFFVPFFFAEKLKVSFWILMALGLVGLFLAYLIHRWIFGSHSLF